MKFPVALLVVLGSVACTPAFATITTYKSRAAFEAAGTTTNLADFEGLALGSHGSLIIQNGVRLDTTYAAFSADLFLIPGGSNFTNPAPASEALSAPSTQFIRIGLATFGNFYAFGADFITNDIPTAAKIPTLTFVSFGFGFGQNFYVPVGPNSTGFFGVRSTTAFQAVDYVARNSGAERTAIDNVSLDVFANNPRAPGAVPEPATWAFMVLGFGGMGALLRQRRRALSAV